MLKAKTNYTAGSIGGTMIRTMIAMLPGTLAISGYNIADTFFVARLGTDPLAAMGFTFPVIMLVNCVFHGLGVGVMATVAHAVGGDRAAKAAKLVSAGMVLAALIALLLGMIGYFTMDATFRRFGAEGAVLELVSGYMSIWYLGCVTAALAMIGNHLLIAVGDSRLGGLVMCCGLGVNVLLDPLFIFGWGVFPAMGIRGAALATILAQAVGASISAAALARRHHLWDFHAFSGRVVRPAWSRIIRFAIPATIGMIEIHRYSGFFFTGCGRPRASAWLAALRIAGLLIPFSLLALWAHSLPGLFWARLGADVLSGATGWTLVRRLTRRLPADGVLERKGKSA